MTDSNPEKMDWVEAFRRRTGGPPAKAVPLSLREKWLAAALAAQLIFVSWALGGIRPWGQCVLAGLSLLGFCLLFLPVHRRSFFGIRSAPPLENLRLLLRFPVFWLGLFLMIYIGIQAWNIHYVYMFDGRRWWIESRPHHTWLPAGMKTPWGGMNPWRVMMLLGSPWLFACVLWVGLRRRRALRALFWLAAVNAALWAVFAFVQRLLGARKIFWLVEPEAGGFLGTIIYKNHAGAWLSLQFVLCLALYLYYFDRSKRVLLSRGGPHMLFGSLALLMAGAIILSFSRGAILISAASAFLFLVLLAFLLFRLRSVLGHPLPALCFLLLMAGLAFTLISVQPAEWAARGVEKSREVLKDPRSETRYHLQKATWDMFADRWLFGWGAGAFRYYFPLYRRHYDALDNRFFARFAHCDWLQFPAELGVAGCGFIVLSLLCFAGKILQRARWLRPHLLMLFGGCLCVFCHGAVDFIFYCPAVIMNFTFLLAGGVKWLELQRQIRHG